MANRVGELIRRLLTYAKENNLQELENEVIQQSAAWTDLMEGIRSRIIDEPQANVQKSKIRNALGQILTSYKLT